MDVVTLLLIGITILFCAAELFTTNLVFASFALGTGLATISHAIGMPPTVTGIVAIVGMLLGLMLLRPIVLKHIQKGSGLKTGVEKLSGATGVVVESKPTVLGDVPKMLVEVSGQNWSARTLDGEILTAGTPVWIVEVDGATVIVAADKK